MSFREMMLNRLLFALLVLATPLGIGCTQGAESSTQAEVSDSAGTRIVLSQSPRWAQGEVWTVSPDPSVTIGVLDGPEEYQLVDVADVVRRSDGSYVVADRGTRTVRLYGSDGTFRREVGGPGAGPGEFTDPGPLLVTSGDTLVVWDQALLRITRFDSNGELADMRTVDWGQLFNRLELEVPVGKSDVAMKGIAAESGLYPGLMEPLGDGSLLVRLGEKADDGPSEGYHRKRSGALRLPANFSVVDTLMFFGDTEQFAVEAPWGPYAVAPPLARRTEIAHRAGSSRICIGEQEIPEIVCLGPDGRSTLIRWAAEPAPVLDSEIAEWREGIVQEYDLKLSRSQVLEMLDRVPIPDSRPPYTRLFLDPADHLWAEKGPTPGREGEANDFMVFAPEGALLGTVSTPSFRILEIGLDYVLGIQVDELGIQYVRLHDLNRT